MPREEININQHLTKILRFAEERGASDVHINVGVAPVIRIDGKLRTIPNESAYTVQTAETDILSTLTESNRSKLSKSWEVDFSFAMNESRIRANVFYERNRLAAAYRLIPKAIRSIEALKLPSILKELTMHRQGLILITGPAGHGKSTTMAAMIDHINSERSENIITIEDPIEYEFTDKKSIISQREVGGDTKSFAQALISALREDPNVILVGEMRDLETIAAALTLAETGHLVLATLHTVSAAQTVDRVIDVFPPAQQQQVRSQLSGILRAIISQRLLPRINGGRIPALELLIANNAVRNLIREGKIYQLDNIIQVSASEGMISLDLALADLVNKGEVTLDDALTWATSQKQLKMHLY